MKKFIALVLTLALAVSLCACSSKAGSQTVTFTVPMDDSTYTFTAPVDENGESATLPGGATIALAAEQASLDDGADTLLWKGIQTFAGTYGYTAENHTAADTSVEAAEAALREAAESGAALVVCRGEAMAQALFNIQNNYPGVHYLLFDGEPHNSSYTNYTTESNVHCVLFQEEQAGFLAGYAAVTDGYTQLGFIGAEEIPDVVRYVTGFLQGAEYAAEQQGLTVDLRTWFAGTYSASDDTTNRMLDWCNNGTTLLFVNGGNLIASAIDAAKETTSGNEVRVMASDYDQNDSSDLILGSAIKCYNSAVQQELYAFFSGNAAWDQTAAGQSEKVGYTTGAVALAGPHWRFAELSQHDYERLYTQLRNSDLKVDTYADMNTLPDTPNVTVEEQN